MFSETKDEFRSNESKAEIVEFAKSRKDRKCERCVGRFVAKKCEVRDKNERGQNRNERYKTTNPSETCKALLR